MKAKSESQGKRVKSMSVRNKDAGLTKPRWLIAQRAEAFTFTLALALPGLFSSVIAASFSVSGRLTVTNYNEFGKPFTNHNFGFEVTVVEQLWQIRSIFAPDHSFLSSYDGTNIYQINYQTRYGNGGVVTNAGLAAAVTAGPYPWDGFWYSKLPWLAFASGSYLEKNRELPAPWSLSRSDPSVHIYTTEIIRSDIEPRLPSRVRYIVGDQRLKSVATNEHLDKENSRQFRDKRTIQEWVKPFRPGFVAAEYVVEESRNLGELQIPTRFTLKRYLPYNNSSSKVLFAVYHGEARDISLFKTEQVFIPPITSVVDVTDFRFRDKRYAVDYIWYRITNGVWRSHADPELQQMFHLKRGRADRRSTEARGNIILVLLILVGIAPAFVFLKSWSSKNNNKDKRKMKLA